MKYPLVRRVPFYPPSVQALDRYARYLSYQELARIQASIDRRLGVVGRGPEPYPVPPFPPRPPFPTYLQDNS